MNGPVVGCGHYLTLSHNSCLWHLKWCPYFSCKFLLVVMARDLLQFPPPDCNFYLVSALLYTVCLVHGGRFQIIGCQCSWEAVSCFCASWKWFLLTQGFLKVGLQWWGTLQFFFSFASLCPLPIRLIMQCSLSLPGWQGHPGGFVYSDISFWALHAWQGCPPSANVSQHFCWVGLGDWVHI